MGDKNIWVLALERHSRVSGLQTLSQLRNGVLRVDVTLYQMSRLVHGPGEGWGDINLLFAGENDK